MNKFLFRTTLSLILVLSVWITQSLHTTSLPTTEQPVCLYSTQAKQDLQDTFIAAIESAHKSIHLTIYSLNDPIVIAALKKKAEGGVAVSVICDATASPGAKRQLGPSVHTVKRTSPGLMHQKILVVDGIQTWIGSANMTPDSLHMHSNLVLGFNNEALAQVAIQNFNAMPEEGKYTHQPPTDLIIGNQRVELWFLPDNSHALTYLISLIQKAKKSLRVAMFTWTHPKLTQAVIDAHNRGLDVRVMLDHNSANSVSAATYYKLKEAGVDVSLSNGAALLHHKMLCIDNKTLITGSANWTRAAFTQNDDCFVVLHKMTKEQKKLVQKIWNAQNLEKKKEKT